MLIGKDYLRDDNMPCKFLSLICTNVLLHSVLNEKIPSSSFIS